MKCTKLFNFWQKTVLFSDSIICSEVLTELKKKVSGPLKQELVNNCDEQSVKQTDNEV